MEKVIDRIKDLCSKKNINIALLERKLNFGNGTIRKWDNSPPSVEKFKKVADYFNISMEFLMEGKGRNVSTEFIKKFEELNLEQRDLIERLMENFLMKGKQ